MLAMAKSIKKLFTPILNGIAVSTQYLSATPVCRPISWVKQSSVATHANKKDAGVLPEFLEVTKV